MTLHRQSFIAFVLLTAVVSVFFSPLLPAHNPLTRQSLRASVAAAASSLYLPSFATSSFSSTAPEQHSLRPEGLIELHCSRLC
jgi:hypothetical protein